MGSSPSNLMNETASRDALSKRVHRWDVLDYTSESDDDSDVDSYLIDENEQFPENEQNNYDEDNMNENLNNFENLLSLFTGRINLHHTNDTKLSKDKLFKDLNEAICKVQNITNLTNTEEHDLEENLNVIEETFDKFRNINPLPYDVVQSYQREAGRLLAKKKITRKMCSLIKEGLKMKNKHDITDVQLNGPVRKALSILWNFSNRSREVTYDIANESEFLETLRDILESFVPERKRIADMTPLESDLLRSILGIIHNTGMVEENIPRIKSLKIMKTLCLYLESENNNICLIALAILANIIDEKESETLQKKPDAIQLLQGILKEALQNQYHQCACDGVVWDAKECAHIVRRLAKNDGNKKLLVDEHFLPHLVKLLQEGTTEEQKEAVGAILSLSFNDENQKEIIQCGNPNLVLLLFGLMRKSDDKDVRKAADGCLWTLLDKLPKSEKYKRIVDFYQKRKGAETLNEKGHIMISYNRNHRPILITIKDELIRRGFRVWMDVEQMKGSTIDAMYNAVQSSHIVLMCMSQAYKDSDYCRLEAINAWKSKKNIIPLLMQKEYKADGWLDMILELKKYYDFSDADKYPFETMFEQLLGAIIDSYGKENVGLSETSPKPASKSSITSVRKWKQDEVNNWIRQHGLPMKLSDKLTGRDLSALITMKKEAPESFYNLLQKNLKLNLATMDLFIEALSAISG